MTHRFTHTYWCIYTPTNHRRNVGKLEIYRELRVCFNCSLFWWHYTRHMQTTFVLFKQALCLSVSGADHCCCGGLAFMHSEALQWTRQTILLWGRLSLQVSLSVCLYTNLSELEYNVYVYFWACNIFLIPVFLCLGSGCI